MILTGHLSILPFADSLPTSLVGSYFFGVNVLILVPFTVIDVSRVDDSPLGMDCT